MSVMTVTADQQINFYRPDLVRKQGVLDLNTVLQMISVIVIGMILIYGWSHWQGRRLETELFQMQKWLSGRTETLARTGQQVANSDQTRQLQAQLKTLGRERIDRSKTLSILEQNQPDQGFRLSVFMKALSEKVPDNLWLTRFSVDGQRKGISIQGRALNPALIPELIERLSQEKDLIGIDFRQMEIEDAPGNGSPVTFSLHSPRPKKDQNGGPDS